jgi:hypothetical protein
MSLIPQQYYFGFKSLKVAFLDLKKANFIIAERRSSYGFLRGTFYLLKWLKRRRTFAKVN